MDTIREEVLSVPLDLVLLRWKLVTLFFLAVATTDPVLPVPVPQVAAAAILELLH